MNLQENSTTVHLKNGFIIFACNRKNVICKKCILMHRKEITKESILFCYFLVLNSILNEFLLSIIFGKFSIQKPFFRFCLNHLWTFVQCCLSDFKSEIYGQKQYWRCSNLTIEDVRVWMCLNWKKRVNIFENIPKINLCQSMLCPKSISSKNAKNPFISDDHLHDCLFS